RVMKTAAGRAVSPLLGGSDGTPGGSAEVSLKVLPVPPLRWSLRMSIGVDEALSALHHWAGEPLPLSASCWGDGKLIVRFAGSEAAVESAGSRFINRYSASPLAEEVADAFWHELAEHRLPFFHGDVTLWRISVPSTAPHLELPGRQLIEWGGGLRWYIGEASAAEVRAAAQAAGGTASRFRGGVREDSFHPLSPAMLALQRRARMQLDPLGIFNPGRMYAAL